MSLEASINDIKAIAIQEHKLTSTTSLADDLGGGLMVPWFDPCEVTPRGGKAGGVGWAISKCWERSFQEEVLLPLPKMDITNSAAAGWIKV